MSAVNSRSGSRRKMSSASVQSVASVETSCRLLDKLGFNSEDELYLQQMHTAQDTHVDPVSQRQLCVPASNFPSLLGSKVSVQKQKHDYAVAVDDNNGKLLDTRSDIKQFVMNRQSYYVESGDQNRGDTTPKAKKHVAYADDDLAPPKVGSPLELSQHSRAGSLSTLQSPLTPPRTNSEGLFNHVRSFSFTKLFKSPGNHKRSGSGVSYMTAKEGDSPKNLAVTGSPHPYIADHPAKKPVTAQPFLVNEVMAQSVAPRGVPAKYGENKLDFMGTHTQERGILNEKPLPPVTMDPKKHAYHALKGSTHMDHASVAPNTRKSSTGAHTVNSSHSSRDADSSFRSVEYSRKGSSGHNAIDEAMAFVGQDHTARAKKEYHIKQDKRVTHSSQESTPRVSSMLFKFTPEKMHASVNSDIEEPMLPSPSSQGSDKPKWELTSEEHIHKAIRLRNSGRYRESTIELQSAVNKGSKTGCLLLALALRNGTGIQRDLQKSIEYLRLATEGTVIDNRTIDPFTLTDVPEKAPQPLTPALFELGNVYLKGIGVEVDEAKALNYIERSASLGFVDAMCLAGTIWSRAAINRSRDSHRAAAWFRLAEAHGCDLVGAEWIYKEKYLKPKKVL